MKSVDKNDVDISKLFNWGDKLVINNSSGKPIFTCYLRVIGDADLNIYLEKNSDIEIRTEIWAQAEALGYQDIFIPEEKFNMLDDHTPFLEAGMPAVDLIDFDYPYWHTTEDTPDKVSAESLQAVGDTILAWLESKRQGLQAIYNGKKKKIHLNYAYEYPKPP